MPHHIEDGDNAGSQTCQIAADSQSHRRTRRGGGGSGRPPGLEKFQGKLCFQGNRKFLKNPE